MLKQQREFNRKKEYARQCRVKVGPQTPQTDGSFDSCSHCLGIVAVLRLPVR